MAHLTTNSAVHPLRAWRKRQKPQITMAELAARVGTTEAAISRYETGRRVPAGRMMLKIMKATNGRITPRHFGAAEEAAA